MKFLVLLVVAYAIYKLVRPSALFGESPKRNIKNSGKQASSDDADYIDYEEVD